MDVTTKVGTARRQGVLKSWNDERGFGFIAPHDGGPQVFVHARHCELHRMQRPQVGLEVTFEVVRADDGRLQARKVLPRHGWTAVDRLPDGAIRQQRADAQERHAQQRQGRLN
ncbi:MAG: cold shock domain-containing protein, partial [Sphaerotilus sp.]|nr:cold shock domain-containing protein [Sphaerotilus sp.]